MVSSKDKIDAFGIRKSSMSQFDVHFNLKKIIGEFLFETEAGNVSTVNIER